MTQVEVDKVIEDLLFGRPTTVPVKWLAGEPGRCTLEIDGERWTVNVDLDSVGDGTCAFDLKTEKENTDA